MCEVTPSPSKTLAQRFSCTTSRGFATSWQSSLTREPALVISPGMRWDSEQKL